jgi:hypothetical protein
MPLVAPCGAIPVVPRPTCDTTGAELIPLVVATVMVNAALPSGAATQLNTQPICHVPPVENAGKSLVPVPTVLGISVVMGPVAPALAVGGAVVVDGPDANVVDEAGLVPDGTPSVGLVVLVGESGRVRLVRPPAAAADLDGFFPL